MNELELTGRARTHVEQHDPLRCAMHPEALQAFLDLRAEAAKVGFDLLPISSYRDIETQRRIWNRKFRGERPLYAPDGVSTIDAGGLSDWEKILTILSWSALPGGSRHHWGTDVDIYDGNRVASPKDVQLLPFEAAPGGPFFELHQWISQEAARFGFFRPYDVYRGGMQPEPWHLSFAPVAGPALKALTVEVLDRALEAVGIDGNELVRSRLAELHTRHILNISASLAH